MATFLFSGGKMTPSRSKVVKSGVSMRETVTPRRETEV